MVRLLSISNYNMEVEIVQYNQLNVIGIDVEANSKTGECFDEKNMPFQRYGHKTEGAHVRNEILTKFLFESVQIHDLEEIEPVTAYI